MLSKDLIKDIIVENQRFISSVSFSINYWKKAIVWRKSAISTLRMIVWE